MQSKTEQKIINEPRTDIPFAVDAFYEKNPPVPYLDKKMNPRFQQVGAESWRVELSVKQTLSIAPNKQLPNI